MGTRDENIVECAIAVISRYGYKKTTMGDLADAAGVSRQTLYNKFPNKEEVLRAAVRHANEAGLKLLNERWDAATSLSEKIDIFFEIGPLKWYDTIMASPDSADLLEGFNAYASDLIEDATKWWTAALAGIFEPYESVLEAKGLSAKQFADFVYTASASAKYNATSRVQLQDRLATLKVSTLATVEA